MGTPKASAEGSPYGDAYGQQKTVVAGERAAEASEATLRSPGTCAGNTERPAD